MGKQVLDTEVKKLFALYTVKWCKKNLGINKRKKTPRVSLRIRFDEESDKNLSGFYFSKTNKIVIYDLNCNSLEDVVSTVIHEYTHYLQSWKKYWEYFEYYYYSTHPFEKQARKNEDKYTKKCLRNIKKQIKIN